MVDAARPTGSVPQGPAIDVIFNLGGGRYQTRRQCPLGGPPSSSSSTLVVEATVPTRSAPRRLVIDIFFNLGGGHY
jgi:hypothetical protein